MLGSLENQFIIKVLPFKAEHYNLFRMRTSTKFQWSSQTASVSCSLACIANLISWLNGLNVWMCMQTHVTCIRLFECVQRNVSSIVESTNFRLVDWRDCIKSAILSIYKVQKYYKIVYCLLWFTLQKIRSINYLLSVWALLGLFFGANDATISSIFSLNKM